MRYPLTSRCVCVCVWYGHLLYLIYGIVIYIFRLIKSDTTTWNRWCQITSGTVSHIYFLLLFCFYILKLLACLGSVGHMCVQFYVCPYSDTYIRFRYVCKGLSDKLLRRKYFGSFFLPFQDPKSVWRRASLTIAVHYYHILYWMVLSLHQQVKLNMIRSMCNWQKVKCRRNLAERFVLFNSQIRDRKRIVFEPKTW